MPDLASVGHFLFLGKCGTIGQMNRREFFRQAAGGVLIGAATAGASFVEQARQRGTGMAGDTCEAVSRRLDAIESRFDRMEHHHRNLLRVGALAFTVSTGIDVFTLL